MTAVVETLGGTAWRTENARRLEAATSHLLAVAQARARGGTDCFDGDVDTPLALEELARRFTLDAFERDLLLVCALHARSRIVGDALRQVPGFAEVRSVTFALTAALLRDPQRTTLSPSAALRRWRLVELRAGLPLDDAPIDLDERVQFYLEAHSFLEPRLEGLVRPCAARPTQHAALASRLARALAQAPAPGHCPVVELTGATAAERQSFFAAVCKQLALQPHVLDARDLPALPAEREALARLWERETMLQGAALLVDAETLTEESTARLRCFLQSLEAFAFVSGVLPRPAPERGLLTCDLPKRDPAADVARWRAMLGPLAEQLNGNVEHAAWQFALDDQALGQAAAAARAAPNPEAAAAALWNTARMQSRHAIEALVPRIETRANWDDLVIPQPQLEILRSILVHTRERNRVYREWGFADKGSRGLGITALFAGGSGTGKTLAAEVLANELKLDLYKIDLASIVSKYIGETEKNLARIFDAAETSGAILLFDEADALFGKRSEVRDSHDRYANIEVSYLLQRVETYRGLTILTSNLKNSIDNAFLRRLRFIAQFPFPDAAARRDIWARVFPASLPRTDLDFEKLARLNLTGGHIRNIALNAAFIAAGKNERLGMAHLRSAAETEFVKLERPVPRAEIGDWT